MTVIFQGVGDPPHLIWLLVLASCQSYSWVCCQILLPSNTPKFMYIVSKDVNILNLISIKQNLFLYANIIHIDCDPIVLR